MCDRGARPDAELGRACDRARRARDQLYSADRRRRLKERAAVTSAEFAAVAATVAAERRERARLESEATLLRGRLAVQETAVRVLEARRRRIADAPDAARDADPRPFPEALVAALEREYGGDMRKVVRAMLRAGAAARRPAWRPDPVEVLTQLFKRPPRPSPQVGLPFGLVMTMVPGSLPWSSELLCSIKARYLRSILLAPDCPMLSISTLLPADLERIVTSDSSRAGRGAFSPRSELERALLERGKDKWRTSCRFAARLFARFDSSQAQTSAAYVGVVDRFLVPLGRSFVSEHFDCLAGSCLCVDGESAARETGRVAGWDALRVSPAQEQQAVELYEELETLLGRVSRDAAREAHAAADAGKQEPVGNPLKDATAREALIEHLSRAAASSERVYHTIMWYNLRLQCVFSAAQLCKAAGDPGRPMLPFEFVCAVVQRRRSADLAAAEALQS